MKKFPSQSYFKNKRVLIRVDFNVEIRNGKVIDDFRILKSLETIKYVSKTASKIILVSHMTDGTESLSPVARHLSKLLKKRVFFVCGSSRELIDSMPSGSVILLENLRFNRGEKKNSLAFAKKLAGLADVFVNDAFGEVHRKVASMIQLPKLLPSFSGFLMQNEIKNLEKLWKNVRRPFVAVLGGAKMKTKLPLIKNFIRKADAILLGGGIANTFLLALGLGLGKSIVEPKELKNIKKYLSLKNIYLPVDFLVASSKGSKRPKVLSESLNKNEWVLDIGPQTIKQYQEIIASAKTIIWNGPMGYFENPVFAKGTKAIAKVVLENKKAFKVIGGGETLQIVNKKNQNKNLFISTGGGAMLEFLAGKKLPGFEALNRNNSLTR